MTCAGVMTPAMVGVMTPAQPSPPCTCTPTQALDKIERTMVGHKSRVVSAISLGLVRQLQEVVDDLSERAADEDAPRLQEYADELAALYRQASRGICKVCGSYDKCPDQIATGGY